MKTKKRPAQLPTPTSGTKIQKTYRKSAAINLAQKQYQQSVERAGSVYVIATSFEQFLNWYEEFNHEKK